MLKFMQNYQKVSVEYLKALNIAIIHEKGLRKRTVLIIESVLIFEMSLKLPLCLIKDISKKKIQSVLIVENTYNRDLRVFHLCSI